MIVDKEISSYQRKVNYFGSVQGAILREVLLCQYEIQQASGVHEIEAGGHDCGGV